MANTVTKSDLIQSICASTGLKRADAEAAVQAALEGIQKLLQEDGKLTLVGFGTFSVTRTKARKGVNPFKPTETIDIPARNRVKFKPGTALKDAVN